MRLTLVEKLAFHSLEVGEPIGTWLFSGFLEKSALLLLELRHTWTTSTDILITRLGAKRSSRLPMLLLLILASVLHLHVTGWLMDSHTTSPSSPSSLVIVEVPLSLISMAWSTRLAASPRLLLLDPTHKSSRGRLLVLDLPLGMFNLVLRDGLKPRPLDSL
jgi:hypothetical protein